MSLQETPLNAAYKAIALTLPGTALDALARNHDLDHVILALRTHLAQRGGGSRRHGGLSPYRENQAKLLLLESVHTRQPLDDIARAVGLSRGHFIRAFQETVGETPHRWLTGRKIEQAQKLLRETSQSLTEIALTCGFSDQSHFTRVFSRVAGTPPGAWRHNRG